MMKVLCPVDFSNASVNAANWIVNFLDFLQDGELHLIHAVNVNKRAEMFLNLNDFFKDKAEEDMLQLKVALKKNSSKISITTQVIIEDPKSYVSALSKRNIYDWIITGTKGLTSLKDITVGSVTEYIINHSDTIIFTIPEHVQFKPFKSIVLGVDDQLLDDGKILNTLKNLSNLFDAKIYMVHVRRNQDSVFEYDPAMDIYLDGVNYEYKALEYENSVAATISEYTEYVNADVLCMIHRKKNWLERLFNRSVVKKELFEINTALMVLHAS